MSSELDEVARALFNGQIPAIWKRLAPDTLKSLGNWMSHFKRRYEQYSGWVSLHTYTHRCSFLSGIHEQLIKQNLCPVGGKWRAEGHVAIRAAYPRILPDFTGPSGLQEERLAS